MQHTCTWCGHQSIWDAFADTLAVTPPSSSPMQGRNKGDCVPLPHTRLQHAREFPVRIVYQHKDARSPACNDCSSARMSQQLLCSMHSAHWVELLARHCEGERGASHAVALHEELRALRQDVVSGPDDDVRYCDLACKSHLTALLSTAACPGVAGHVTCAAAPYMLLIGCFDVNVVLPDHAKQVLQAASAGRSRRLSQ